jgi:AAA15 family ATPase/GTPase
MKRVQHVKIENFKKIKLLEFNPSRVNIVLGANNRGKTSVLEAIYLALIGVNYSDMIRKYQSSGKSTFERFLEVRESKGFREYDLFNYMRENPFRIEAEISGVKVCVMFDEREGRIKRSIGGKYEWDLESCSDKWVDISYIFLYPGFLREISLLEFWSYVEKKIRKSKVEEILKILEKRFNITDLRMAPLINSSRKREFVLHYREGDSPLFPIFMLGSGVRYLLALSILAEVCDVILFDDLEAALHPDVVESFVEVMKNSNSQFFLTTQSKELINKLVEHINDLKVIYLYSDGDYEVYSKKEAEELIELRGDLR